MKYLYSMLNSLEILMYFHSGYKAKWVFNFFLLASSIEVKNKKRKNDKFYKKIFKKINFNFNNYHKISLSYLESEILFGLFLRRSLSIIKNRWDIVNFFYKKNYKFFINSGQNITFSFDTNFNNILREKTFNDFIFHEILKFLGFGKVYMYKYEIFKRNCLVIFDY